VLIPKTFKSKRKEIYCANPETKEIPILAVTALFRSADLEACMKAGCVGLSSKTGQF
jgi:CheY-like chemotaxis protein